jgi:hypothetical protein
MDQDQFSVETAGQSGGHCDCCGHESRTVWGYIRVGDVTTVSYFVHWTRGQPEHHPNLDFLIGSWGDNARNDRVLVSWVYSAAHDQFMIVDSDSRPAAGSELCSRTLTREDVRADPELLALSKALLDAVWLGDDRIGEVKAINGT